ncbi:MULTISPECIES: hypothetical protein, partial [unclassified Neisseria]
MDMPTIEDVKQFLKTLVLGEFEGGKQQSSTAIMVRGLVGLIPGIDQILDAQDTIGLIYRLKEKNWQLDQDDYADIAFTTFGWMPEVGSLFKGVLKPIWRNRHAGNGVRNGILMLEGALGKRHGAFIGKARDYVNHVQKWNQAVNTAITKSREAIDAYLEMLNVLAKGSITLRPVDRWQWTHTEVSLPALLVSLAKGQIPVTRRFKANMESAILRGSETVRRFLKDLLGEHAELVTAAIQGAASHTHRNKNNRPAAVGIAGRNAAQKRQKNEKALEQKQHPKLNNGKDAQNAATNRGRVASAVQNTVGLAGNALTGIVGEHMADYWMLKQVGGRAAHDKGGKSSGSCHKINYGGVLYQLHVPSVNPKGIDSLWKVDGKIGGKTYCIVEAKASATSLTKSLGALLTDNRDKTERRTVQNRQQLQMSTQWCNAKLQKGYKQVLGNYSRRVVFFNSDAIAEHLAAYSEVLQYAVDVKKYNELSQVMNKHQKHEPTRVFTDADIDAWVKARTTAQP